MPRDLKRFQQTQNGHFITFSCFRRQPLLRHPQSRDVFLDVLEETRRKFHFVVVGYVIMPEHVHLLIAEPERDALAVALQMLKQNSSRLIKRTRTKTNGQSLPQSSDHFWQKRYYDFNVWSEKKRTEKLKYMHRNPVERGLVTNPEDWQWSSYRAYAFDERGPVLLNDWSKITLAARA